MSMTRSPVLNYSIFSSAYTWYYLYSFYSILSYIILSSRSYLLWHHSLPYDFFKFSIASPQLHIRAEDYDNGIGFQQVRTVCTDTNTYSDTYTYACTNASTTWPSFLFNPFLTHMHFLLTMTLPTHLMLTNCHLHLTSSLHLLSLWHFSFILIYP